jgi:hypothetical protein
MPIWREASTCHLTMSERQLPVFKPDLAWLPYGDGRGRHEQGECAQSRTNDKPAPSHRALPHGGVAGERCGPGNLDRRDEPVARSRKSFYIARNVRRITKGDAQSIGRGIQAAVCFDKHASRP